MDMDGTLLDADHVHVSKRNVEALRAARDKGVKIVLASGRTWCLLGGVREQLGCVDYGVISNGAAIVEAHTGEYHSQGAIPNAQALLIADILCRYGLYFEVYAKGECFVQASQREYLQENYLNPAFGGYFASVTTWCDSLERGLDGRDVEKFNIIYLPPEIREQLEADLAATRVPLEWAHAFVENMEFSAKGIKKGETLAALCRRLGITPDEVMAFGDGGNDVDMLNYAGLSFAMENGAPSVKRVAKYLAPPNTNSGVGRMVEKYILL